MKNAYTNLVITREYAIKEIEKIEYAKIFRHIQGCIVTLRNGDAAKFGMTEDEYVKWSEKINSLHHKHSSHPKIS